MHQTTHSFGSEALERPVVGAGPFESDFNPDDSTKIKAIARLQDLPCPNVPTAVSMRQSEALPCQRCVGDQLEDSKVRDLSTGGRIHGHSNLSKSRRNVHGTGAAWCRAGCPTLPGCQFFRANPTTPIVINNAANNYLFEFQNYGDSTGAVRLRAARIYYKLQVSPAPGKYHDTDVPTSHAFFQFIEALASSGITAGCSTSPPQFCPDAPLTRGQMAVFLSRALGLHWVP